LRLGFLLGKSGGMIVGVVGSGRMEQEVGRWELQVGGKVGCVQCLFKRGGRRQGDGPCVYIFQMLAEKAPGVAV
nr:hypothetical protein [Tanacetum cinerariifolium]